MITVRVPASTANLGPGFDALGLALSLTAEVGIVDAGWDRPPAGGRIVDEHHPADVAFRRGGGSGALWARSPIPMARGLGFSGAMRVGGLVAAAAQEAGGTFDPVADGPAVLEAAAELEGHADNVGASLHGGLVATAAGRVVHVPIGLDATVVVWIPPHEASTQRSRNALPPSVSFADAVFNVGRAALLVAALVAGDIDALRVATEDRLHQDRRLDALAPSRAALTDGLAAGAWCGWLSGSGPTIAFLCAPVGAATLAAALPADGHTKLLSIAPAGAEVLPTHV